MIPLLVGGLLLLIAHHQGQKGKIQLGAGPLPSFNAAAPPGTVFNEKTNLPDLTAKGLAMSESHNLQLIQAAPYFAGSEPPKLMTEQT